MEWFIFIVLIGANAIFALVEMSLAASRSVRLQASADNGDAAALRAIRLQKDPGTFIGTTQLGLNLVALLSGIYVENAFTPQLRTFLIYAGMSTTTAGTMAFITVIISVTLLFLLFGELIPKRIAMAHPEQIAKAVSGWFTVLTWVTKPPLTLLEKVTGFVVSWIIRNPESSPLVTTDELRLVLEQSAKEGTLQASAFTIVENALDMDDRLVVAVMVPRSDMMYLDTQDTQEENLQKLCSTPYHRFVVCEGGLDNIKGLLDITDAIPSIAGKAALDLTKKLEPIHGVPESLSLKQTMDDLQLARKASAVVINEFNEVIGMVSLNDIYAAVMGDTTEETGDQWIQARTPEGWYIAGIADMEAVKLAIGLDSELPGEKSKAYHTVNGFVMYMMCRMPREADTFEVAGYKFEVSDIDGRFVDKVLVVKTQALTA